MKLNPRLVGLYTSRPSSFRPVGRSSGAWGCVASALGCVAAVSIWSPVARAQIDSSAPKSVNSEFSVQRFNPAPGPRNYFTTRGARVEGHLAWSAGMFVNYANKPFVVVSCESKENCDKPSGAPGRSQNLNVVENLATADVLGSLTLIDRLQLGLRIPVTVVEGDGISKRGGVANPISTTAGLGDMELELKGRAYGEVDDPFVVGAALFATAPLGSATSGGNYIGDSTPTVGLRGIFDGAEGPFSFGGNLSGIWRGQGRVGSTKIGPEFRYNVAGGYQPSPVVRIVVDGFGATKFSSQNGTNSLEIDLGAQIMPIGSKFVFNVGGGPGVIEGVGVPTFRGFVGVMYVAQEKDRDGDGIMDDADQCPTEPEDIDQYEDSDGCPDPDNDGDTIADSADRCPDKAEDPDGFEDTDGCPDLDNDGDGVGDDRDQCPEEKETKNGFEDEDGCPDEKDTDRDGVPDKEDKCIDKPEDTDGFEDTDGCPDPDNDADGIPDERDECVDTPETKNGFEDEDGCPDEPPEEE